MEDCSEVTAAQGTERSDRYVFISYSSKDSQVAADVCRHIERAGFRCWIAPRNVHPGENYPSQIVEAIRGCSAFVLLASTHTNVSGHVSNEVALAFDGKKIIIPFRIEEMTFSDEYLYFLGRKHWIDAYPNVSAGFAKLTETLTDVLKEGHAGTPAAASRDREIAAHPAEIALPAEAARAEVADENVRRTYSRAEIVGIIRQKSQKFPYNLLEKLSDAAQSMQFREYALKMFALTAKVYYGNRMVEQPSDLVAAISEELIRCPYACVQVRGLPGGAKNMLLQLVFYDMLDKFERGESDCLPYYISLNYFEKFPYQDENEVLQMRSLMTNEYREFFDYLAQEPEVRPVFFVDAIRDYVVKKYTPESVLLDLLRPYKRFSRMTALDVGLITTRSRMKRVIPILGERNSYVVRIQPVPMSDGESVRTLIGSVIDMYRYDIDRDDVYEVLCKMHYTTADIFLVRMIITEMIKAFYSKDLRLTDMYEELALGEMYGDKEQLEQVSREVFRYIYEDDYVPDEEMTGKSWSLPNKHHTYREFLIAYYFITQIERFRETDDHAFFSVMLTATANHFLLGFLEDNYLLQETLLAFVTEEYASFDVHQKSNAAYWLGRVSCGNLAAQAKSFLLAEFERLKPVAKKCNRFTKENKDAHFLFRSICNGLVQHNQANVLDDYLCLLITNDVANAINRGATVEYFSEKYQMAEYDDYYLDDKIDQGEEAITALNGRIEHTFAEHNGKFVESNLVTLLTILQMRAQSRDKTPEFDIVPYLQLALKYIRAYRARPQSIASGKILYYMQSIEEEFGNYLAGEHYDVAALTYNKYKSLKSVKRLQWVQHGIEDAESVADHTYSAWLLAMFFLPEEQEDESYNKREILDMLLIHDIAEAELGDQVIKLNESHKQLREQNDILRKRFLKGTYPDMANMTYYYNVWTGYYNGLNINAKIARDINLIQSVYTFCEYCVQEPSRFREDEVGRWLSEKANLNTDLGYRLFERLIERNSSFSALIGSAKDIR